MNSTQSMTEFRCEQCGKLLAYLDGNASIKCDRCKGINILLGGSIRYDIKKQPKEICQPKKAYDYMIRQNKSYDHTKF